MLRTKDGKPVKFVSRPELAPEDEFTYARPDDMSDQGGSWRDVLLRCNANIDDNQLGLLPACELYAHAIYQHLADHLGRERLFVLSAGWGLIGANFLTPDYDITFSTAASPYNHRKKRDGYADFSMLSQDTREPILFFGGKDYLPLFLFLTSGLSAPRTVFYTTADTPDVPGGAAVRYGKPFTNWHYPCAKAFLDGDLSYAAR